MPMKLLIVGRTASGKDALRRELMSHGVSFVKSVTDRPQRKHADKDTHVFITPTEMDNVWDDLVASTTIGNNRYGARREDVELSDAYIVDPKGLHDVTAAFPDTPFMLVDVRAADESARLMAATGRGDDPDKVRARNNAENEQMMQFEKDIADENLPENVIIVFRLVNDYTAPTLTDSACHIISTMNGVIRLEDVLRQCRQAGVLAGPDNDPERLIITYENGDTEVMTFAKGAALFMGRTEPLGDLFRVFLSMPHATLTNEGLFD